MADAAFAAVIATVAAAAVLGLAAVGVVDAAQPAVPVDTALVVVPAAAVLCYGAHRVATTAESGATEGKALLRLCVVHRPPSHGVPPGGPP